MKISIFILSLLFIGVSYAKGIDNTRMVIHFKHQHNISTTMVKQRLSKISHEIGIPLQLLHEMAFNDFVIDVKPAYFKKQNLTTANQKQILRQHVLQKLKQLAEIGLAEADGVVMNTESPMQEMQQQAALLTSSPSRSEQWDMLDSSAYSIKADTKVWQITKGDPTLYVGVLDHGSCNSPGLEDTIINGYDFATNEPDPIVKNGDQHGCGVTGILAMHTSDISDVEGVAPNIKVVFLNPFGTKPQAYASDVATAIEWGIGKTIPGLQVPTNPHPIKLLNMSLGSGISGFALGIPCSSTAIGMNLVQAAMDDAYADNVAIPVSGGNENVNAMQRISANCNHVIAVGASTDTGVRASYSNYGDKIDIAAPADPSYPTTIGDGYGTFGATSGAAPHVAGTMALMLSINRNLTVSELLSIVQFTATPFAEVDPDKPIGAGIVNALRAVQATQSLVLTPTKTQLALSHYPDPFHACTEGYFVPTQTEISVATPMTSGAWQLVSTTGCQAETEYDSATVTQNGQTFTAQFGGTKYQITFSTDLVCTAVSQRYIACKYR